MYSNKAMLQEAKAYNFEKVLEMLSQNVREESAKAGGKQGQQKVIDRLIKAVKGTPSRNLWGAMEQKDGRYAFTDGMRLFFADNPMGYDVIERGIGFDALKVLENLGKTDSFTVDEIDLKTFINVNGMTRANKKKLKSCYIVKTENGQYIGFEPFFLTDAIDYSDSAKFECSTPKRPALGQYDTVVLPVNIDVKTEDDYNAWREKVNIA